MVSNLKTMLLFGLVSLATLVNSHMIHGVIDSKDTIYKPIYIHILLLNDDI